MNLKELLSFAWNNKFSDFYRTKYKKAGISKDQVLGIKNFTNLPLLTRRELELTPPDKRLFVAPDKVEFVAYTSGTTSQIPLITYFSKVDNYYFNPTLGLNVKKLLITYPPLNKNFGHTFVQQCIQAKNKSTPVFADFQNLANSSVIAAKVKIDSVYATPTIALMLSEHLKQHYDLNKIKLLALSSETLTQTRRQQLKQLYPAASIANLYASSEIGQFILYPCKKIINQEKDLFHILKPPVLAAEIIDGELVITYANNKAMPLIRYRTGDFFEIAEKECGCGIKGPLLRWSGKKDVDKIRVGGTEIKIEDVEKVFLPINHLTNDNYQIHLYEKKGGSFPKIKIIIEIIGDNTSPDYNEGARIMILNYLLNNWQIRSSGKLKDDVSQGLFEVPEIKFVKEFSFKTSKTRRLISHLDTGQ